MNRKLAGLAFAVIGVVALALALVAVAGAQGGPGGQGGPPGGGRGGNIMGAMMYLERAWTAVSFQLGCTHEQIELLHPIFAAELKTRNDAVKKAMEAQDWESMRTAITTCQSALEAKLAEVLTEEQLTALDELMAVQMMGGRGGRGGPGGGPGGGAGGGGQN